LKQRACDAETRQVLSLPQIKEPQKPHGASFEAQLNGYLRTLSLGSENIRDARTTDTDDMYTR